MDANAVTLIIGAIGGAVATILGVIFTKGRLAEVITGSNTRQNTAVDTLAEMLEQAITGWLAGAQAIALMTEQNERRIRDNADFVKLNTQQHAEIKAFAAELLEVINSRAEKLDRTVLNRRENE